MKSKLYFAVLLFVATLVSCKDDDDKKSLKGDPDLQHQGEEWNVARVEYELVDQSFSGSGINNTVKMDTKENAGTFYFKEDGSGSFELVLEGYNKEDVFSYTLDNDEFSIIEVTQSVGVKTNQNTFLLNGSIISESERTLTGLISKQSPTNQFALTVDIILQKKN